MCHARDFNHIFEDCLAVSVASAELSATPLSHIHSPGRWHGLLAKLVEIRGADLNHFNTGVGKINLLSRAFVSMPKWMCLQFSFETHSRDPVKYYEKGLSDHAPTVWRIMLPQQSQQQFQSIPSFITRSSIVKQYVKQLICKAGLEHLGSQERYDHHKLILLEAARLAREELFDKRNICIDSCLMIHSSCARAVVHNNVRTARLMLSKSEIAQMHICISEGKVCLIDPPSIAESFTAAKLEVINSQHEKISTIMNSETSPYALRKRKRSQLAALVRMAALWKAKGPCVHVAGILSPSGSISRSPEQKSGAYRSHCGPTFEMKLKNMNDISTFVKKIKPWNLSLVAPPSLHSIEKTICPLEDCGCGPDGLAYSAWDSYEDPRTLCLVNADLMRGIKPRFSSNASRGAFLKKGDEELDHHEIIRYPSDTRPLGLRNSHNKILCSVSNRA